MNIYIGNLPYSMNEEGLKTLFDEFGEVESAKLISDKFSGRSKGFGFIEMPNEEEAKNAIETLNEKEIDKRNIKVNKANPKGSGSGGGGRRRSGGGGGGRSSFGSGRY